MGLELGGLRPLCPFANLLNFAYRASERMGVGVHGDQGTCRYASIMEIGWMGGCVCIDGRGVLVVLLRDGRIADCRDPDELESSIVILYDVCDTDHQQIGSSTTPDQQPVNSPSPPRARYSMPLESLPTRTEVY
jgi:hypothetical protein